MFGGTVCVLCLVISTHGDLFQMQDIVKVRNGIERSLMYIHGKYKEVNVDCLFGVTLTQAVVQDVYQNGSHIMDESSKNIIRNSADILKNTASLVRNEDIWVARSILDYNIWIKNVVYKKSDLFLFSKIPNYKVLENIYRFGDTNYQSPNTNSCLQDVANWTSTLLPKICSINEDCWNNFYELNEFSSGYMLTHKLLLLQLAKARQCIINKKVYDEETKLLCSFIYAEVFNGDYFKELDAIFDLFLEEIVVCGYEGYTEFLKNKWLYYILESQKDSGCFPAVLRDERKSKIKRNINVFEDGCADHTTGLGLAALSLYYNFIVKEIFILQSEYDHS